jgi:hypothetical protein
MPPPKLDTKIRKALEDTGLPWHVQGGSKHWQVRLQGRLVGILPRGAHAQTCPPYVTKNFVAHVRRLARELKEQAPCP